MRNPRMNIKPAIGLAVAAVVAVVFCYMAIAADLSTEIKPAPVDPEQYADFMAGEALDVQDLAEGAEIQRRMFNRITPPGISWLQPMFPSVVPFDAANFAESFLDDLLGEDKNSVAIYPLSLALDPKTRETLVYNADGKLIAAIPADKASRVWPEDSDPARVTLQLDLLPSEDVELYLYAESRIAESIATFSKSKPSRTGGIVMRSLGSAEFGIADIRRLSNGTIQVTVSNGTDVAELFSYTVLHTSTVVVTTWTNEEQVVITDTNTLWYPASPSFNGIESEWACGTTNLVLTNGIAVWEDSSIATNDRVRFYAAAKRADADVDGLTDGMETFLYRTDPGLADTDLDGHSDGREIALETDPLNGSDYFGIVINAALPIHNAPENPGEWVELFNAGPSPKSLAGFRLQTAKPAGWTNVFTFPAGVTLDSGDFLVVGTNGDYQAALGMPNSSSNPPAMFGIRLVVPSPASYVADALLYGVTNEYNLSMDGFGEEMPILRPWTNWVIRRTWIGYDTDHAGDWKNMPATSWLPHTQGDYLDLDGDGLSNSNEMAGGLFPIEGGTQIDETDSDFDGVSDADEATHGTDANNVDTDGDAFPWDASTPPRGNDADELSSGTDPLDYDSDNDGVPDGWELWGGLNPLSTDSDNNAMPDGDEDTDGDGIPNAVEVSNFTNPFDADDVDPRPYIWLKNGQIVDGTIDEGDIGHDVTLTYHIQAKSNCPPIMVRVVEGGHVVESFDVEEDPEVTCVWLNPNQNPPTNRVFYILTDGETNFTFKVIDGGTTWQYENPAEYGADIILSHAPALLDLDAGVAEESEETVGFLLADKSAHPNAARRALGVTGPDAWGYVTNLTLAYNSSYLQVYDDQDNEIDSGTQFTVSNVPPLYVEGIAHSGGMRDAWIEVSGDGVPVIDRANATVLKADIGSVGPLADKTLHPEAEGEPLQLIQTLPSGWNGLMQLSLSSAAAYWTPTGSVPIVLGSTMFTNAQLPKTIYLKGDGCGTGQASFSVVGLSDCVTNIPLQIFGVNATLAGVAELDEESPGGFIADRSVHTNTSRTALTLEAFGPSGSPGNLVLTWDSSRVQIYTAASGGTALSQFVEPFASFNSTTLYVEGIAPGSNTLSWSYSEQTKCKDSINVAVVEVEFQRDGTCSGYDDTLVPPWIMVPVNDVNTALAVIDPPSAASHVNLISLDTGKATVTPSTASTTPQIVSLTGVAHGDTTLQSQLSGQYSVCAILNVAAKRRIDKTIAIHAITEENDDIQVIPIGQGQPNQTCVTAGTNSVLNSITNGDDVVSGSAITTGPNGICETFASGDDVQVIPVGNGCAYAAGVAPGANNFRDTPSALGDDSVSGDNINTGIDGICDTDANATNIVPSTCPSASQLQSYLNGTIWGRQANVHFTVTRSDYTVNYDLDRSGTLAHPSSGGAPNPAEGDAISSAAIDNSVDYNIYYVFDRDYSIGTTIPSRGETWTAANGANSPENHTAHEVGHLLGIYYESYDYNDVMLYMGQSSNPCRVIRKDWNTVNP